METVKYSIVIPLIKEEEAFPHAVMPMGALGDFRVADRNPMDAFLQMRESNRPAGDGTRTDGPATQVPLRPAK